MELIAEKGWEATTAAEIGRRAGYSRAMVHARYGSKDAILETLFATEYENKLSPALDPSPAACTKHSHTSIASRSSTPRTATCCERYSC